MSKFCRNCGASCQDTSTFCLSCGASLDPNAVNPHVPAPFDLKKTIQKVATAMVGYGRLILIGVVILCLFLGILNTFSTYDVEVTLSVEDESVTQTLPLQEVYEADEFIFLALVNTVYGLYNLVMMVLAVLIILGIGKNPFRRRFRSYNLTGIVGTAVYLLLFWISGSGTIKQMGIAMKYSTVPHFLPWIALVVFGLLYAASRLAKKPRRRRIQS